MYCYTSMYSLFYSESSSSTFRKLVVPKLLVDLNIYLTDYFQFRNPCTNRSIGMMEIKKRKMPILFCQMCVIDGNKKKYSLFNQFYQTKLFL